MEETTAAQPPEPPDGAGSRRSEVIRPPSAAAAVPTPGFSDLRAPDPVTAAPSERARVMAFAAVLIGGLLGGLVGFGIGDVLYADSTWSAAVALAGALTGAIGLGVLANLTLRAMNEWKTATHPESGERQGSRSSGS